MFNNLQKLKRKAKYIDMYTDISSLQYYFEHVMYLWFYENPLP